MKYKHIIYNNNCIWIILITYDKRLDLKTMLIYEKCLIKDRNGMDLTEAEDIKKRWQEVFKFLWRNGKPSDHIASLQSSLYLLHLFVWWVS